MKKVMIIGANGSTAKLLIERLLNETTDELVLFLRQADRLSQYQDNPRVTLVDGNVLDTEALRLAMQNVDIVYSNVGGTDLGQQTQSILTAMHEAKQTRLIFISALGARHEVPGKFGNWNEQAIAAFLPGFREAAKLLNDSDLIYTELRPAWLTDQTEVDYETTGLDEPFKGTEVSRASVADYAFKLIENPKLAERSSVGLNKPDTDGDKPSWM
ncbi:NAD(P)H-binding protein [Lactiplantibacillus plantarum]|uniref:Oxidoreductase n=1 Tax=Lactiplantibacillus plantarum TaxID=1590 RepID=A0A162HFB4_LACPN|nr:NAD(P)H-binding protein [Lactiplantibacillus plantarum]AJO75230.1 NAD-dependent dehydratase [Lactiplantibacillus plantarum]KKX44194.1 NAD-dependent dehydratase [Lactiplantibacillus plantarum]KZU92991.1 oxidoreductase [Lactiplantibacillus plantarum]MCW0154068.1 NAD(P)H-binding protein [Lactiplantibacillus plantarum]QSE56711.1 NAD(P)H-binding protein [Lactiplantibacillus plantarum]